MSVATNKPREREQGERIPQVAVITRTKNRNLLLRRAIESVLRQRFQDWVHVIVNDGGPAAALDLLVAEYSDLYRGRVRVVHNDESVGMQEASNLGLGHTESEFVVVHDDDDAWDRNFLRKVMNFFAREPETQGVVTRSVIIHETVENGSIRETRRSDYPMPSSISLFEMAAENLFPPIAFVYRRSVHETVGLFDNQFTVLGDWDFNLRFLMHHEIKVLDAILAHYHHREIGDTSAYGNSVTSGQSEHAEKLTTFQNVYLRKDIRDGRLGLGTMVNVSRAFLEETRKLEALRRDGDLKYRSLWNRYPGVAAVDTVLSGLAARYFGFRQSAEETLRPKVQQAKNLFWTLRLRMAGQPNSAREQNAEWVEGILAAARTKEVISFDIFDTVLHRTTHSPVDVFDQMEADARDWLGRSGTFFRHARIRAEHRARLELEIERQTDEVSLDQIYATLARLLELDPGHDGLDRLKAREIELERKLLHAVPFVKDLIERLRTAGKRVIFVSDMYLPSDLLREILVGVGIDAPEIFVSCEHGVSKGTGGMYRKLPNELGVEAGAILHLGDNRQSDVINARQHGLDARLIEIPWGLKSFALQSSKAFESRHLGIGGSIAAGLAKRHAYALASDASVGDDEMLARRIGFEFAGPMFLGFTAWCIQQAEAEGRGRLLFLARDGYYLKECFDRIKRRFAVPIEADYCYASRRLFSIPAIRELDDETLDFLLKPSPLMTVRHFLERVEIESDDVVDVIGECGLPGADQIITNQYHAFRNPEIEAGMRRLFYRLQNQIFEVAAAERETLHGYLKDLGLDSSRDSVVDLGWHASNLRAMNRLAEEVTGSGGLPGFYFGTWEPAESVMLDGWPLQSYFVHLGQTKFRKDLLMECVELLELLFNAPHPSITGLRFEAGKWIPKFGTPEITEAQSEWMKILHASALQFVDEALELLPGLRDAVDIEDYLEAVCGRIFRRPTAEEGRVLGAFSHRDAFGGGTPTRHLALVPEAARQMRDRGDLRRAYQNSFWRKGFEAQLNPFQKQRAIK